MAESQAFGRLRVVEFYFVELACRKALNLAAKWVSLEVTGVENELAVLRQSAD